MGFRLSDHFTTDEFACRCGCGFGHREGDVSLALIDTLEEIRELIGRPIKIASGCRCEEHNRDCGGVENSAHLRGAAADIVVYGGEDRYLVIGAAYEVGAFGIGVARSFVHVDVDVVLPRPAAWTY